MIFSPDLTTFPKIEIHYKKKTIHTESRTAPHQGYIVFNWEYGKAEAGNYVLYIVDGQGQHKSFVFQHNPKLF